jgi:hypothetical protein
MFLGAFWDDLRQETGLNILHTRGKILGRGMTTVFKSDLPLEVNGTHRETATKHVDHLLIGQQ